MGNISIKGSTFSYNMHVIETKNREIPPPENSMYITEDAINALKAYIARAERSLLENIETAKVTTDDTILYRDNGHTKMYSISEISDMENIIERLEARYALENPADYIYLVKAFAIMPEANFKVEKTLAMELLKGSFFYNPYDYER